MNAIIMIMFRKFVNRKSELKFLNDRWKSNKFEFMVLYGRRRIGKTELIKKFIEDKPHVYFLCDKRGTKDNIKRFKKMISKFLNEPEILTNDLEEIFNYFVRKIGNKRIVIVFDEFPYLIEEDPSIPSVFQRAIDNVLVKSKVYLILCGSSMSMMERGVLSRKSPLYGRKTGHLKLNRMPFSSYFEFFPKNSFEKNLLFFSITGGVPFYMEKFSEKKSVYENVKDEIALRSGSLFEEPEFLLREEFREPETYKKIIEAIAFGKNRIVEISNYTGIPSNQLSRYINPLIDLGIIEKEGLITKKKTKKTLYFVKDNFINFYFRFIEPFKSDLEIDELKNFKRYFDNNFNQFVGMSFERLVREEIIKKIFPNFSKFGRWWGHYRKNNERKEIEIDIVGLNENKILFGECKWKSNVNPKEICRELEMKSKYIKWRNKSRKEIIVIFAKSFSKKVKEFNGRKVYCFDMRDLTS